MQLKEILSIEQNRTEETKCVIHLFQEGSFYRAYEWSAWLCHRYINEFKVTHKHFRSIEPSVLFVGFPVTSFPKYAETAYSVTDVEEKRRDMVLHDDVLSADMQLEEMVADYDSWKSSIPVQENISKSKETQATSSGVSANAVISKAGIVQQIIAFPLESKSPLQCMMFIADLKQQVASII